MPKLPRYQPRYVVEVLTIDDPTDEPSFWFARFVNAPGFSVGWPGDVGLPIEPYMGLGPLGLPRLVMR